MKTANYTVVAINRFGSLSYPALPASHVGQGAGNQDFGASAAHREEPSERGRKGSSLLTRTRGDAEHVFSWLGSCQFNIAAANAQDALGRFGTGQRINSGHALTRFVCAAQSCCSASPCARPAPRPGPRSPAAGARNNTPAKQFTILRRCRAIPAGWAPGKCQTAP